MIAGTAPVATADRSRDGWIIRRGRQAASVRGPLKGLAKASQP